MSGTFNTEEILVPITTLDLFLASNAEEEETIEAIGLPAKIALMFSYRQR
jgi:hypothetical protein